MIYGFLTRSLQKNFVRNAAILVSGTALAQVATLVTAPILTRIYTPGNYGLLAIYIMLTTLVGSLSTLQYNNIILTAKEESEAKRAIILCLYLSAAFAFATLLAVSMFGGKLAMWLKSPQIKFWLYWVPISVFFSGWSTAFTFYANRKQKYKLLSENRIIAALVVPVISITFGFMVPGPMGLFLGLLIGQVLPAILLSSFFFRKDGLVLDFSLSDCRYLLLKYKAFPLYSLPTEFINSFINQLPVLLLGRYYNPTTVGYYNLSTRMLGMPVQLVSNAVGEVFRQKAAQDYTEFGNSRSVFLKTLKTSVLLSLVPFAVLLFAAPRLFSLFFGIEWIDAGVMTQLLVPLFLLRFTVSPLSYMFIVVGKQREDLVIHVVMLILILAAFILARHTGKSYYTAVAYYSAAYSLIYLYYILRSYRFSKGNL